VINVHANDDPTPLSNAVRTNPGLRASLEARGLIIPTYDRTRLRPRIAHIGVGGFHRAHLALYVDHLARTTGSDWGIRGIGLLAGDARMRDALAAQDHLYTFTKKGTGLRETEVVGSIVDFVLAAEDTAPAVTALADPDIAIVSMTVTESGYSDEPRNLRTFDVIAEALEVRRAAERGPVTILSCDNLPDNGDAAGRCVLAACRRRSDDLAAWVEGECRFPNSMVDRITPVTAEADIEHLRRTFGLDDRWPVVGEPFWQWVLEDDFAAGRPDFAAVGALYTGDVHAWELYKLRLLNAGHSCIAYLSALERITYVDEAVADPAIRAFLTRLLLTEAVPTLTEIPGHTREDYAHVVIERFANTGVRDQISRLCIDGTAKFPTFLMPTIAGQLERGGPLECAALALAGWAHYLANVPEPDQAPDALGEVSRPRARAALQDPAAFCDDNPAFPPEIATSERFRSTFADAYRAITDLGAHGSVERLLGG
jgi:mannitol 2-dehydrogenase